MDSAIKGIKEYASDYLIGIFIYKRNTTIFVKEQSGYYQCTGKGAMKGIMTKWSSETATPTVSETYLKIDDWSHGW